MNTKKLCNAYSLITLACLYIQKDQFSKADEVLKDAESLNSNNNLVKLYMGWSALLDKNYDKAFQHASKNIKLNPSIIDSYLILSALGKIGHRKNDCIQMIEKAINSGILADKELLQINDDTTPEQVLQETKSWLKPFTQKTRNYYFSQITLILPKELALERKIITKDY